MAFLGHAGKLRAKPHVANNVAAKEIGGAQGGAASRGAEDEERAFHARTRNACNACSAARWPERTAPSM